MMSSCSSTRASGSSSHSYATQQLQLNPKAKAKRARLGGDITNFLVRTTTEEAQKLDIQLAKYFFATNTAFNHVEHVEFKKLCAQLRPGYNPPSRKKLSTTLLDEVFLETVNEFKDVLQDQNVCMSLDGWSNVHREPIVCAVVTNVQTGTLHLIDTINTEDNKHDFDYLCQISVAAIKKCTDEFNCRVTSFVTDNAANMTKMRKCLVESEGLSKLDIITYGCSSHIFNLLAHDIEKPGVADHIKQIIKYFRNTHVPSAKYRQAGGKMLVLPSDVRWNTLADTLESYLNNWHILSKVCTENRLSIDRNIIAKIENIQIKNNAQDYLVHLKVIAVALDKCQRNSCTISDATDIWKEVLQHFENEVEPTGSVSQEELSNVRNRYKMAVTEIHFLAYLLDPQYLGQKLTNEEVDVALSYVSDYYPDVMPEVLAFRAMAPPFKKYLFIKNTVQNTNCLTWWRAQKQFISKNLYVLTTQLFSAVASTAGVERLFSTFGLVHNKLRNRLGGERAAKLVTIFQHYNNKNK